MERDRSAPAGPGVRAPYLLVVEDEPSVTAVMLSVLGTQSYTLRHTADPREALRILQEEVPVPDLLLTDYLMPHLTGLELIARARVGRPELRTILCTGQIEACDIADHPGRPDRFLEKPFGALELLGLVRSLLRQTPCGPVA
jgi:CheY-like chemotaxis protein